MLSALIRGRELGITLENYDKPLDFIVKLLY